MEGVGEVDGGLGVCEGLGVDGDLGEVGDRGKGFAWRCSGCAGVAARGAGVLDLGIGGTPRVVATIFSRLSSVRKD